MEVSFKDQENEVIKEMIKRKYFGFQSSLSCSLTLNEKTGVSAGCYKSNCFSWP